MSEIPNPFKRAKIVAENATPAQYLSMGAEIKRGDPRFVMSGSNLTEFATNPRRWVNGFKFEPDRNNGHIDFGAIVDCLYLTSSQFESRYAVTPTTYRSSKGEQKDWTWLSSTCREWREAKQAEGKEVITPDKRADAEAAVEVLFKDTQIATLTQRSRKQVLILAEYHDADSGLVIPVKMMPDMAPEVEGFEKCLINLKTTFNAAPGAWLYKVEDGYLHWKAAMHLDGWVAATGQERNTYLHLIQESVPPYDVSKRYVNQHFLEIGRASYIAALQCYCACLASKTWFGYDATNRTVILGDWAEIAPNEKTIRNMPEFPRFERKEKEHQPSDDSDFTP